jgi:hypothetical protein
MAIGSIGSSILSSVNQSNVTATRKNTAANMLEDMDTDKSGSVSKAEFVAIGEKMKANAPKIAASSGTTTSSAVVPTPPSSEQLFTSADENHDSSLSVDELSAMLAQAEVQRGSSGSSGAVQSSSGAASGGTVQSPGGAPKGAPPGGGGPPAGGGTKGASGSKDSESSSSSSSATTDPADTNKDGTVSAAEDLVYKMTHPAAATET